LVLVGIARREKMPAQWYLHGDVRTDNVRTVINHRAIRTKPAKAD